MWRVSFILFVACAPVVSGEKMDWPNAGKLKEPTPIVLACDDDDVIPAPQKVVVREEPPVYTGQAEMRWPLMPTALTSPFGIRNDPLKRSYVRFHKGIDLSAALGAPVHAALPGRIVKEGWGGGHGQRVTIDHGGGLQTSYSHLSIALVSEGMLVPEGQTIGLVGDTGRATGPHLHFEVTVHGEPTDPLPLLGGRLPNDRDIGRTPIPPKLSAR